MKCMRCGELDASLCTRCVGELTEPSDWDLWGPDLLAACTHEVIELANLAAMVDPDLTHELMTAVYAIIAAAKGEQPGDRYCTSGRCASVPPSGPSSTPYA